ncbi:hydantoinase B/oxoprolinase family protein [Leucobacter chironomi]|uniref:hydantoinase B/oxoprolinase family protein n=1 Tax=Leucobacter chironomi TaxID=491918 RepID=UPI0003FC09B6|nr:hydantoinase B/oxoprolinase family protein [Leucobacter chironomi]
MTATHDKNLDPITFSVIMSRFHSIANEMTITLERSAWTSILALCRDYSCAVYDADNRQLAMEDALPIHTTSLGLVLAEISRTFEGDINDGDVFICNDPYRYNTHVGDVVTAAAVFVDGEHRFWSVTKGHQMDIGAFVPSSVTAAARNIYQEGLTIPPVKLFDAGKERKDITDLYLANLRYSELLHGDLMAQLGSIEKGKQRLVELREEYGTEEVLHYSEEILRYADRRMAEEIRAMPDGVYYGEGWIDSDGVDVEDIPIRVKVTIADDQVEVDYTESGPQAQGGVNGSFATSSAAGAAPFMYYINPDIPHNQGAIDHIKVVLKEGTICLPEYPASTSAATIVPSDMMSDAINKALSQALPKQVLGGTARCANVPQFSGAEGHDGEPWGVMMFNNTGASGAASDADGWPLFESHAAFGGLKAQSIEQLEMLYPLMVDTLEVETDSMGHGRQIGGPGVRMAIRSTKGDMECITFGDGAQNPPHGVAGGLRGCGGGQYVENLATDHRRYFSASGQVVVKPGERHVGISTGGGGNGDPRERDVELVRQNARDGWISRETALEVYGVVLSDDLDPVVDETATTAKRRSMPARDASLVEPLVPSASTWLEENMRDGDVYLLNPVE